MKGRRKQRKMAYNVKPQWIRVHWRGVTFWLYNW